MAKENKREQILSALGELLPGKRFHEITLDEVARAAQVGKGTIYLYFQDKEALFGEMICYQLEQLQREITALTDTSLHDLPQKLYELVAKSIQRHNSWFGAVGEMASHIAHMSDEQHDKVRNQGQSLLTAMAEVMQKANPQWTQQQSIFNARILLWLIDGSCRTALSCPKNQPEPADVIDFFRRGAMIDTPMEQNDLQQGK